MRGLLVLALGIALAGLTVASVTSPNAEAAGHARVTILRLTGTVTADNAAHFTEFVAAHQDRVIGLQVHVRPGTPADFTAKHYMAEADDRLFVVFKRSSADGGTEVVAPKGEANWLHGDYVLDGFYVVKSGGMHQGTLSYGLEKTDEGVIRANPDVLVKDVPISR